MEWILIAIHQTILGVSLAAPVGPINIEMIKRGITGGFWSSWFVGLGGMTADILFMLLILVGLTSFIELQPVTLCLYAVGFFMLSYVGIKSITQALSTSFLITTDRNEIEGSSYITGLLIALTNPLNIVFWFGVFGSTLSETIINHSWLYVFLYSFFIIFGILIWNLTIAGIMHFARRFVNAAALRTVTVIAGSMLIVFGIQFGIKLILILIN
ncbi:amino acid transporter [Priestia megaterium]|nr:amino acid transporter [Priestia megaterium]